MRQRRLELLRQALGQTPFILCLDETGDRKKGHTTDYVATQYIGNFHTLANGICHMVCMSDAQHTRSQFANGIPSRL